MACVGDPGVRPPLQEHGRAPRNDKLEIQGKGQGRGYGFAVLTIKRRDAQTCRVAECQPKATPSTCDFLIARIRALERHVPGAPVKGAATKTTNAHRQDAWATDADWKPALQNAPGPRLRLQNRLRAGALGYKKTQRDSSPAAPDVAAKAAATAVSE